MPLLILALIAAGIVGIGFLGRRQTGSMPNGMPGSRPQLPPANEQTQAIPIPMGNALDMLRFPDFQLEPNRPAAMLFLSPAGAPMNDARVAIGSMPGLISLRKVRGGISIPPFNEGDAPGTADLWEAVFSQWSTRPELRAFSQKSVLDNVILRTGRQPASPFIVPARQLATILHENELVFASVPGTQPLFIPVAGRNIG